MALLRIDASMEYTGGSLCTLQYEVGGYRIDGAAISICFVGGDAGGVTGVRGRVEGAGPGEQ